MVSRPAQLTHEKVYESFRNHNICTDWNIFSVMFSGNLMFSLARLFSDKHCSLGITTITQQTHFHKSNKWKPFPNAKVKVFGVLLCI